MRLLATLVAFTALAACETAEGFGRDVSAAGNEISEEAQKAQ